MKTSGATRGMWSRYGSSGILAPYHDSHFGARRDLDTWLRALIVDDPFSSAAGSLEHGPQAGGFERLARTGLFQSLHVGYGNGRQPYYHQSPGRTLRYLLAVH